MNDTNQIVEPDWANMPIDTKVMVRDGPAAPWNKRYYEGYRHGRYWCFNSGMTSWSAEGRYTNWSECRLPTEEELK